MSEISPNVSSSRNELRHAHSHRQLAVSRSRSRSRYKLQMTSARSGYTRLASLRFIQAIRREVGGVAISEMVVGVLDSGKAGFLKDVVSAGPSPRSVCLDSASA